MFPSSPPPSVPTTSCWGTRQSQSVSPGKASGATTGRRPRPSMFLGLLLPPPREKVEVTLEEAGLSVPAQHSCEPVLPTASCRPMTEQKAPVQREN